MKKGFTLIEMLVAISIVSVLSSVALVSMNSVREKARVSKATQEVEQIMLAAALVYDEYGYYPNDSHSVVVCPKDIVIDDATGKTWGSYLQICNDPWGKPYEWNNKCLVNGVFVKRSSDEPQVNCQAYSDSNEGPIGVVVNRDGTDLNIPGTCVGTNLCYGQRGHEVLNWGSSVDIINPPPVLICVSSISQCSALSTLQCATRAGCGVVGSSCVGTIATSCSSFSNQSQCSPGGCTWSSSGSCGGTVSCSLYNSNQTACLANSCSYTASVCSGTAFACTTWNNNKTGCQSQMGCSYNTGNKKCSGTHSACGSYDSSQCGTQSGCSFAAASCSGSPSCSGFGQSQCSTVSNCSWTDTSSCQGNYSTSCNVYDTNQTSCQSSESCSWTPAVCAGSAASCSTLNSQTQCSAQAGCSWE